MQANQMDALVWRPYERRLSVSSVSCHASSVNFVIFVRSFASPLEEDVV